jgi:vacuolar iron transporter family protein
VLAALTTAVAGALSMGAGAYVASSSTAEVTVTERRRRQFLGDPSAPDAGDRPPVVSALFVGVSYFVGALIPVLPVLLGARTIILPLVTAGAVITASR